ncbi:MAG: Spy/CpxP family protein refolding chaperone [Deltaproteobacteria bacterium]|nr:Spy/CpxP family protein refolding chaperone [Deltaproteobacteria bacterium]
MHPGMMYWWKSHRGDHGWEGGAECGVGGHGWRRHHRHAHRHWREYEASHHDSELGAGAFGVRRPLRYLAHKLDLDEAQVTELARVLSELKTERAQAEVDGRRATAAFADALGGESFDLDRANAAGAMRVASAEHLRGAVVKALGRIHAMLEPEQRERLAYLIRTGTLQI